jgi:hypothetical protein
MLKRIAEWTEAADRLCDAILDGAPTQYREHDLMQGKYRDDVWRARLDELWKRDPLTARWIEAQHHAIMLAGELHGLGAEIDWRARHKGLRPCPTGATTAKPDSQPRDDGDPGDLEMPSDPADAPVS